MSQSAHWIVYARTNKDPACSADLRWRPISRGYAVREAADEFARLARQHMPDAAIEVRRG
jgi:hypothetical protein